jgi:hypothetical protein
MRELRNNLEFEAARIRRRNHDLPRDPITTRWPAQTNEEILSEALREFEERLRGVGEFKSKKYA